MTSKRGFKDHFSTRSADYARHRPGYPDSLFDFLSSLTGGHDAAWDCATGSGQAALALAERYESVIATDASAAQIDSALPHDAVHYRVAHAEASGLKSASVDLVTVGQALHWFDIPAFFAEASRVLVTGGVLAIWCYELCQVSDECDRAVDRLYRDITGPFWPPERELIESRYAGIEAPGQPIVSPDFEMILSWHATDMLGYLRTWSACKRYEQEHGDDPVTMIENELLTAWGSQPRVVRWPLTLLASRMH